MKKSGQLIASAAIAVMAMGTLGSGLLVLSANPVAAKSSKGESNGGGSKSQRDTNRSASAGSKSQGKSQGKGKGQYHKGTAKYLKNLNAMCSNGKSRSPNSNVYKINAFYDAKKAVEDYAGTKSEAESTLASYSYPTDSGDVSFGTDAFSVSDAIAYEEDQLAADASYDTTNLAALESYDHALGLEATQFDKLATAVRGTARAEALVNADPTSPEGMAYQDFLNHCSDPA